MGINITYTSSSQDPQMSASRGSISKRYSSTNPINSDKFIPANTQRFSTYAWVMENTGISGKSLGIGGDEFITVDWVGGTIPFTYTASRRAHLRVLAGRCICYVYSHEPSPGSG